MGVRHQEQRHLRPAGHRRPSGVRLHGGRIRQGHQAGRDRQGDRAGRHYRRQGQNQYKVKITVGGPSAKLGPLADKIHIFTNSKHQPQYDISVSGVVRPPFRVEPAAMNFGEVAPSDVAASRAIVVRSNDLKTPERFQVTKVESDLKTITTVVKPTANKGEYEVTLAVAKDAKPGDVEGTVKIYTNDQVNPVVTVPVKATVKDRKSVV